ncbi:TAXI family TRAP transporter solute-binding subunit [Pseudoxanthomonas indica]|nr:TAXI family TRAP transporter solute-binding subunit [Pseudoxanthomonas indica]
MTAKPHLPALNRICAFPIVDGVGVRSVVPARMRFTATLAHFAQRLLGYPLIGIGLLIIAIAAWHSMAPQELVIASGPEGGYFHTTALRYRALLAERGIKARVLPEENTLLGLVEVNKLDSHVDMAFVAQRADAHTYPNVRSLGVITDEPLFVFRRTQTPRFSRLADIKGMRIALGPRDSGSYQLATEVLRAYGVTEDNAVFHTRGLGESVEALRKGEVDVAFILQPLEQPIVAELATTPGLELVDVIDARATSRVLGAGRNMGVVRIPQGIFDLRRNLPATDLTLPTEAVSVVVKANMDPGVLHHLLEVMQQVHGVSNLDREAGSYPRSVGGQLPLHPIAESFHRAGLPFLYRHLPFAAANGIFQLFLLVLPLTILGPVLSFLGVPSPLWFYKETKYRLWLVELRTMLRMHALHGMLTGRQQRRLTALRQLLDQQALGLERCRQAAKLLPP